MPELRWDIFLVSTVISRFWQKNYFCVSFFCLLAQGYPLPMIKCWYFDRRMSSGPASAATWSHGLIGLAEIANTCYIHTLSHWKCRSPSDFAQMQKRTFSIIEGKTDYSLFVWSKQWVFSIRKARERVVQDVGQTTELCSRSGDREGGCPFCKGGELSLNFTFFQ